ncbi:MAG TPA: hemerythrin domain-containing protein [Polyangia bacterium]|nr:hemerythrin domain-containing protein [Polyangia bacterium]
MQPAKLFSYDDGDAIDFLRRQHREIDQLLGWLAEARPDDRGRLLAEAGDLLAVHMAVEERVFYPGLTPEAGEGEGRSFVVLAVEDHFDVKRALTELIQTATDDSAFAAMTRLLRERVRAHATAEERLFPRIRRRLPRARLRRLEYEMRVLEFELRTDAEPRRLVVEDQAFTASA